MRKKILGSGRRHSSSSTSHNTTTLITSNNEIEDIIKIVKSLQDSGLLLKGVTKTVKNEVKEQRGGFRSMLLGTLDANLLGNLSTGKVIYRAGKGKDEMTTSQGRGINRAGQGVLRPGYGSHSSEMDF